MPRLLSQETKERIVALRQKGWSLNEIKRETKLGNGTVFRYIKDVEILPEYREVWLSKRSGSVKRKLIAEENARKKVKKLITSLSKKEKLIFISALYWGEGSKSELNLSNTDSDLIRVFMQGLREGFRIPTKRFSPTIRIYEDLDREVCIRHWSTVTGIPIKRFVSIDVLQGKKKGKLPYGMCRIRLKKGGDMLKYMVALRKEVSTFF